MIEGWLEADPFLHRNLPMAGPRPGGLSPKLLPMRILLLSGLCLTASPSAPLHGFTFTGRTGTKVEAEVVSVSLATNTARLRLPTGQEKAAVKAGHLQVTTRAMKGVGHGFPAAEQSEVKTWMENVAVPGIQAIKSPGQSSL